MKKLLFPFLLFLTTFCFQPLLAQQPNAEYIGAKAKLGKYKAAYTLTTNDDKHIIHLLKNMQNALSDPRLKGKLKLELIVYSEGYKIYEKTGPYEAQLKQLLDMGVILTQCENSIIARKIDKKTLFPFISYVPSAQGEIIIRGADKWVIIQP